MLVNTQFNSGNRYTRSLCTSADRHENQHHHHLQYTNNRGLLDRHQPQPTDELGSVIVINQESTRAYAPETHRYGGGKSTMIYVCKQRDRNKHGIK